MSDNPAAPEIFWTVDADGGDVRASVLSLPCEEGRFRYRDLRTGVVINAKKKYSPGSARSVLLAFVAVKVQLITRCVRKRQLGEWTGQFALDNAQGAEAAAMAALSRLGNDSWLDALEQQARELASGGTRT